MTSYSKWRLFKRKQCAYFGFSKKIRYQNATSLQNSVGKAPPSDIRPLLKKFQETGSVLRRKVAGRPKTSQEVVDRN
jgi:hypothetical protein